MYQYLIGCNIQKFHVLIHNPVITGICKYKIFCNALLDIAYHIIYNYKPVKWEGKTAVNGICAKRMCHDVNNMINSFGTNRLWQCKALYYFELKFTMITAFMVMATPLFLCQWYFLYIHSFSNV